MKTFQIQTRQLLLKQNQSHLQPGNPSAQFTLQEITIIIIMIYLVIYIREEMMASMSGRFIIITIINFTYLSFLSFYLFIYYFRLSCPKCNRSKFINVQGFLNHCRNCHQIEFANHEDALLVCGTPVVFILHIHIRTHLS